MFQQLQIFYYNNVFKKILKELAIIKTQINLYLKVHTN